MPPKNSSSKRRASRPSKGSNRTVNVEARSTFIATLKLTSDWHIGLGAGRPGEIDRLIQRDAQGLPFVPAKTLTGIWRDACETVAFGLDNGNEQGPWAAWVSYLFGDQPVIVTQAVEHPPRPAALSVRAATFSDRFKAAIAGKQPLIAAMTFIKPGIAIEAATGCAKDDFLRFEEMARSGACLQAKCTLSLEELSQEQKMAAYALLTVSTRLVERLGGKRRRGAGQCDFFIDKKKVVDQWIGWLKKNHQPHKPPAIENPKSEHSIWNIEPTSKQEGNRPSIPASPITDWVTVPLQLTALTPLIISSRTLGNVVETLDYIPGSHLLRLVVQRLRSKSVNIGQAIANQELVITHATPEINQQRGLPVPLALFGTKLGGGLQERGRIYNRLVEDEPEQIQLKGERTGYIAFSEDSRASLQPDFSKVDTAVITHNTIEDAQQRPTQAVGGVYSYQAITAGTVFRAELRVSGRLAGQLRRAKPDWQQSLTGAAKIGQSKKDSYGQVKIAVLDSSDSNSGARLQLAKAKNNCLIVWLLSDLLLRDARLRPTTSVQSLTEAISQKLGFALTLREQIQTSAQAKTTLSMIARRHRVESWQVRWGLPRPSLCGLSAGSCFVFEYSDEVNVASEVVSKKLSELTIKGLGERCAEGFGQIAINPSLLMAELKPEPNTVSTSLDSSLKPPSEPPFSEQPDSSTLISLARGDDASYAKIIEKAAWREAIHRAAQVIAIDAEKREQHLGFVISLKNTETNDNNGQTSMGQLFWGSPTMSQVGSLRSVLSQLRLPTTSATSPSVPSPVQTWLAHIGHERRIERWPAGSPKKLSDILGSRDCIWNILDTGLTELDLPPFSQLILTKGDDTRGDTRLQNELWPEAVNTFINLCIRAHKHDLERYETLTKPEGGTDHGTAA